MSHRRPLDPVTDGMPTKFEVTGPHYCPDGCCSAITVDGRPVYQKIRIHLVELDNDGRDIAHCPKCGNLFAVSYQVKKIVRLKKPVWKPGLDLT